MINDRNTGYAVGYQGALPVRHKKKRRKAARTEVESIWLGPGVIRPSDLANR